MRIENKLNLANLGRILFKVRINSLRLASCCFEMLKIDFSLLLGKGKLKKLDAAGRKENGLDGNVS